LAPTLPLRVPRYPSEKAQTSTYSYAPRTGLQTPEITLSSGCSKHVWQGLLAQDLETGNSRYYRWDSRKRPLLRSKPLSSSHTSLPESSLSHSSLTFQDFQAGPWKWRRDLSLPTSAAVFAPLGEDFSLTQRHQRVAGSSKAAVMSACSSLQEAKFL
jgi:hypothetical protein